jgi:hypothetical protein
MEVRVTGSYCYGWVLLRRVVPKKASKIRHEIINLLLTKGPVFVVERSMVLQACLSCR